MTFKKGQSGNPSGRAKADPEFKALCKSHVPEAVEKLLHWMRSKKEAHASIKAALAIIEHAHGKPAQAVELGGKDGGPIQAVIRFVSKE